MIRRWNSVATALLLLVTIHPVVGHAGPYEDGDQAFRKKNYVAARRYWQPAASAGHNLPQVPRAPLPMQPAVLTSGWDTEWPKRPVAPCHQSGY